MSRKDCKHTTVLNKMKDKIRTQTIPDLSKAFCSQCGKWLQPTVIQELFNRAQREIDDDEKEFDNLQNEKEDD